MQDALLDVARFWLDRGVDGFRLDAINFAMHDPTLPDNPPAPRRTANGRGRSISSSISTTRAIRTSSKFLERLRALIDAMATASPWPRSAGDQRPRDEAVHRRRPPAEQRLRLRLPLCGPADAAAGRDASPRLARTPARLAELGVREPRRAARGLALGRRPRIARRSRG